MIQGGFDAKTTEVREPFVYVQTVRFTQRKHRYRDFLYCLDPDAPFELHWVSVYSHHPLLADNVYFRLYRSPGSPLSEEFIRLIDQHQPLYPPILWGPGDSVRIEVRIGDSVTLGLKRPLCYLRLEGVKVYDAFQV